MEESYETFEEELGPPRADPPPQKPVRQIRRPGHPYHTNTTLGATDGFAICGSHYHSQSSVSENYGGLQVMCLEGNPRVGETLARRLRHDLYLEPRFGLYIRGYCRNMVEQHGRLHEEDVLPMYSPLQNYWNKMHATRKLREEVAPFPQQPRAEPKISPREPSYPRTIPSAPLHKDLTQIETPWENVTLNRCLFVAITILVLTSGCQRLHETLRGQRAAAEEEEDVGLTVRRSRALRHRGHPPEPETTLWEVMFWWLPDLDDEDDEEDYDEDDDGQVKRVKSKQGAAARASSLRNKPLPDQKLLKQRQGKLKDRRAKKARDEEIREKKKEQPEVEEAAADEEDEDGGNEEAEPKKHNKPEEKKEKKKTPKG